MKNYPFIGCSIAFLFGILVNNYFGLSSKVWAFALIILIFSLFLLYNLLVKRNKLFFLWIYLSFFLFGNKSFLPDEFETDEKIVVVGSVHKIYLMRVNEISFELRSDSLRIDKKFEPYVVNLLCKITDQHENIQKLYNKLLPGNKVWIQGIFQHGRQKRNPGEFDYSEYLKAQNISGLFYIQVAYDVKIFDKNYHLFKSLVFNLRKILDSKINLIHNEQTAGLLRGLLLADRSGIDYKAKEEFVNSGVIHVLAVSGLHVGFIVIIFITAFGRFNILLRSILTIISLIVFLLITQIPPSAFRAVTMAVVIILSYLLNRSTNIFNSLAIAAFIVLVVNPEDLFNPGFQLSFSAVLSIAVIYPIIKKLLHAAAIKSKVVNSILLFIGVTLSAQIGTLPFTLIYFGKLSLVSLIANLFVIPLIGLIVGIAIFTILISFISTYTASIFSVTNEFLTFFLFKIVSLTGGEYSFVYVRDFSVYDTFIFYLAVLSIILILFRLKTAKGKVAAISLVILNSIVFSQLDNKKLFEDDKLNVLVTDLSAGSSVLIKFPDGNTSLINAGKASFQFDNYERIIKPLLTHIDIKKIDLAVLSNMDEQNVSGFSSLIKSGMVKKIITPKFDSSTLIGAELKNLIMSNKIILDSLNCEVFEFGKAKYYFLRDSLSSSKIYPISEITVGVIKLVYGQTSIIFHNSISPALESYCCNVYRDFLNSNILIFNELKNATNASVDFLSNVRPEKILFIGREFRNQEKIPSFVFQRIQKINLKSDIINQRGSILIQSNGKETKMISLDSF